MYFAFIGDMQQQQQQQEAFNEQTEEDGTVMQSSFLYTHINTSKSP